MRASKRDIWQQKGSELRAKLLALPGMWASIRHMIVKVIGFDHGITCSGICRGSSSTLCVRKRQIPVRHYLRLSTQQVPLVGNRVRHELTYELREQCLHPVAKSTARSTIRSRMWQPGREPGVRCIFCTVRLLERTKNKVCSHLHTQCRLRTADLRKRCIAPGNLTIYVD